MAGVNIKNLPETPQVNVGDLLILETPQGTQLIDFDNFVISESNTTFEPLLSSHTADIENNTKLVNNLSTDVDILSSFFLTETRATSQGGNFLKTLSAISIGSLNTPDAKFTVLGDMSASGNLSAAGGDGYNYFADRVGIGTTNPSEELQITSTGPGIRLENSINYSYSDIKSNQGSLIFDADTGNQINNTYIKFTIDNSEKLRIDDNGRIGLGTTTPHTSLHIGGSGSIGMSVTTEHPVNPNSSQEAYFYVFANKFVIKYNDSGTIRYKSFPLSGTGIAWTHSTVGP